MSHPFNTIDPKYIPHLVNSRAQEVFGGNKKFKENLEDAVRAILPIYKRYGIIVLEEALNIIKERHNRQDKE